MYALKWIFCFFFVGFTGPTQKDTSIKVEEITRQGLKNLDLDLFPISVLQAEIWVKLSHYAVGLTMLMKWPIQRFAALTIVTPGNYFFPRHRRLNEPIWRLQRETRPLWARTGSLVYVDNSSPSVGVDTRNYLSVVDGFA